MNWGCIAYKGVGSIAFVQLRSHLQGDLAKRGNFTSLNKWQFYIIKAEIYYWRRMV